MLKYEVAAEYAPAVGCTGDSHPESARDRRTEPTRLSPHHRSRARIVFLTCVHEYVALHRLAEHDRDRRSGPTMMRIGHVTLDAQSNIVSL